VIQVFLLAFITDQRTQIRDVENKQSNNGGFTSQKFQIMHTRCSQVARRRCFKIQRPVSVWKGFFAERIRQKPRFKGETIGKYQY
jgi:hypothetical protein